MIAENKNNRIITNIKAGIDDEGTQLDGEARDLLRTTYLKPLRDAQAELTPGYKSRLAQILRNHSKFIKQKNDKGLLEDHELELFIKDNSTLILI